MNRLQQSFSDSSKQLWQQGTSSGSLGQQGQSTQSTQLDQLDLLDQVLTEVEATTAQSPQAQPQSQPQPPTQSQPPARPQLPPQPQPTSSAQDPLSQTVPSAIAQATDTLNPAQPKRSAKEVVEGGSSPDSSMIETATGIQYVEQPPQPEIPPEVESYLQKVEDHAVQAPHEVVIADGSEPVLKEHQYPSQPVMVLPITSAIEKKGAKKSPKFSIRWLVEWSRKIMKKFIGMVVYRQEGTKEAPA